jgi:RNA polymerase sigma-70 factor (ECF subfamily)
MPDEGWLVRRAVQGEAAAFEEIMRAHQKGIYRVVLGMVGNHYDADDLTQEAFIRAHRRIAGFRGESSLRTWLTRIALNCAHDHLRRRHVRGLPGAGGRGWREGERVAAPPSASPEARLMSRQLGEEVAGFLGGLSERERTIFSLRFAGGHSLEEIADLTDSNLSTVKTHLYRALAKARRALEGGGGERT